MRSCFVLRSGIALIILTALCAETRAQVRWGVVAGETRITIDTANLQDSGLTIELTDEQGLTQAAAGPGLPEEFVLEVDPASDWVLPETDGSLSQATEGALHHLGGLLISSKHGRCKFAGFSIRLDGTKGGPMLSIEADAHDQAISALQTDAVKPVIDRFGPTLFVEAVSLAVSPDMAAALGDESLSGIVLGSIGSSVMLEWRGGDDPSDSYQFVDETGGEPRAPTVCPPSGPAGPDVIVGDLYDPGNYAGDGTYEAFAIGTISCNLGNTPLQWFTSGNAGAEIRHPVIGQNMFRLKTVSGAARFEHIGQAWLKHGFTALQQTVCCASCSATGGTTLGIGCSDPYDVGLNGAQSSLGPKYQVNAHTGTQIHPVANPAFAGSTARRIRVPIADLESTSLNPTTKYFIEGQYVAQDDATSANQNNNASYRAISMSGSGSAWTFALLDSTQRQEVGVRAWKDSDPSVTETDVQISNDGLVIVSAKATDLGGGVYHYEYAVQNLNSDRCIGSFSVPCASGVSVLNIGFHDVEYHSGEPYDGTDWPGVYSGSAVSWATTPFATNADANAIRWGTLYNFRFDANVPPISTTATLGLFKTGSPDSVTAATVGPQLTPPDCNGNGTPDDQDLANGTSQDCDGNTVLDECQTFETCELRAELIAAGLSSPVGVYAPAGDFNRLFIVEQTGRIKIYDIATDTVLAAPYLNIASLISAGGERGLLGLAFHPNFASNGFFYVNYTNTAGNTVIARYTASGTPMTSNTANAGSALILRTITQDFSNHNGGCLQFGPDGFLYVGMGDGGSGNDPNNRAQDTGQLLGKMLRLDVDNSGGNYIPASNPFVGGGNPLDEIWAIGMRNPWRFSFDRLTGDMYIGDVGQDAREEIDFEPAGFAGGRNYGWDCEEGLICSPGNSGGYGCVCGQVGITDPILDVNHNTGVCSITGGFVYRGCQIPWLHGTYFYADYCANWIRTFKYDGASLTDQTDRTAELTQESGSISAIVSFGEDAAGEMYIVSLGGSVYKIICAPPPPPECGNGVIEEGEECDPPGSANCDCNCQIGIGADLVVFEDTFESGNTQGWTLRGAGSTATTGDWVIGNPVGTVNGGIAAQPEDPYQGTGCIFTAQNPAAGAGTDDVDAGVIYLVSPLLNLSAVSAAELSYARWYYNASPGADAGDFFRVEASSNNGSSWVTVENLTSSQFVNSWVPKTFNLGSFISLTSTVRIRFAASDGTPTGVVVEAALDNIRVSRPDCNENCIPDQTDIAEGVSRDCNANLIPDECENDVVLPPSDRDPNPDVAIPDSTGVFVGDTMTVAGSGIITDVNLDLDLTHTWNGDVTVRLRHGPTTLVVIDRPGNPTTANGFDNNGFNIMLDDEGTGGPIENRNVAAGVVSPPSYLPNNALSAFDGQNINGAWTLEASDSVGSDTGSIAHWALILTIEGDPAPDCPPINDACAAALSIGDGPTAFDFTLATTDGPGGAGACNLNLGADIWFEYTASCTGLATADLCGSSYDTVVAVYDGCACPPAGNPLACNDDACGSQSSVTFPVTASSCYLIRVGGDAGATGAGVLTMSCIVPLIDCNENLIDDACDLDCGAPGCIQPCGGSPDCNANGTPDECDVSAGNSDDCDGGPLGNFAGGQAIISTFCFGCHGSNGEGNPPSFPSLRNHTRSVIWDMLLSPTSHPGGAHDEFAIQDFADLEAFLADGGSRGRGDRIPDECQTFGVDCDEDEISDPCELEAGTQIDADYDGTPDDCEIVPCGSADGDLDGNNVIDGRDAVRFAEAAVGTPTVDELCAGDFVDDDLLDELDIPQLVATLLNQP